MFGLCSVKLILLICWINWPSIASDNPTAIVNPYSGPDPGYILAESDGGLANRLRVLAAYMYIAEAQHQGAHLVFVWDVNDACPGHFLQIFEPIPNVIFATNSSRYVLDKKAKIVYENSLAVFTWTMTMNKIPKSRFGQPSWGAIEYNMYSRYAANREVMKKVTAFVRAHNICTSSAMHIRTTDLSTHLAKKNKGVNLNAYHSFVESRPVDEPVYLLTDNPETQKIFLDKYGPKKIIVYSVIAGIDQQKSITLNTYIESNSTEDSNNIKNTRKSRILKDEEDDKRYLSETTHSKHLSGSNNFQSKKAKKLASDHRYTSIEHTLIDVLIASHSRTFKPGAFSSLSDLVNMFSKIGKKERGWCQ
mmetsp:Transcript_1030/g.1141  ORF Transcript_1030/g.1141 Transcript_1030/m.1141 type:complete len:362 (+) Transcript_1030:270-1355(+)